jgi:hypothetical protein
MNEKYYVIFDGTSAYIVGEEDIKEIESDPFAIEEIYGPFKHSKKHKTEKLK